MAFLGWNCAIRFLEFHVCLKSKDQHMQKRFHVISMEKESNLLIVI